VIFLASDDKTIASAPETVVVPAGKTSVSFPITVYHVHGAPEEVALSATYGEHTQTANLIVSDPDSKNVRSVVPHHRADD
jgi:hypothetical protein